MLWNFKLVSSDPGHCQCDDGKRMAVFRLV